MTDTLPPCAGMGCCVGEVGERAMGACALTLVLPSAPLVTEVSSTAELVTQPMVRVGDREVWSEGGGFK